MADTTSTQNGATLAHREAEFRSALDTFVEEMRRPGEGRVTYDTLAWYVQKAEEERDDAVTAARLNAETIRRMQEANWDAMDRREARDEALGSALARLLVATASSTDPDVRLAREFGDAALKAVRG